MNARLIPNSFYADVPLFCHINPSLVYFNVFDILNNYDQMMHAMIFTPQRRAYMQSYHCHKSHHEPPIPALKQYQLSPPA